MAGRKKSRKFMNKLFQNALQLQPQPTPPIWFMRQAGRYHNHYQKLKAKYTFMQLCREPDLAAQVALGPIQDFDFDVSILFSDLLFPLDALGFGLSYSDQKGPQFSHSLQDGFKPRTDLDQALAELQFQAQALKATREVLPADKSLIGFVGGIWTLFVYACEGSHAGNLTSAKTLLHTENGENGFLNLLHRLIEANIALQLKAGAEVVMIFDTSVGELSPTYFKKYFAEKLIYLANRFPGKIGYYSKATQAGFFDAQFVSAPWAGRGFDHRWSIPELLIGAGKKGFVQGNFDQSLLFLPENEFEKAVSEYLKPFLQLDESARAGWVSGLGHGVLPKTPERNVRRFVELIRKAF